MKTILRSALFHRMIVLAVLIAGLSFVAIVKIQPVSAVFCCLDCEAAEQYCQELCDWGNDLDCPYKRVTDCYDAMGVTFCFQHCTYQACGGGGCTDSSECNPGCVCTGYQCQCF